MYREVAMDSGYYGGEPEPPEPIRTLADEYREYVAVFEAQGYAVMSYEEWFEQRDYDPGEETLDAATFEPYAANPGERQPPYTAEELDELPF